MLRLAHLSDIHFGGEDPAAAEAAIAACAAFAPDLVVITGDLTLNGLPREFEAARAWLDRLPRPRLVTPGNHDTPYWNIPLRALVPFNRYRRFIGEPDHVSFETPGLRVHALNSARGAQPRLDWSQGALNLEKIRELTGRMAVNPSWLNVFACHHPLIDLEGAPVTGGVHRGVAAAKMLAAGSVDLILTGHVHNPFALILPGGAGRAYAVGAGTLSLRTRGTPPGFSTIEASDDLMKVTALGWDGAGFNIFKTWDLPRGRPSEPV
jgi:3',5'-cyclic AMP phosphodiesterase CpdA